MKSALSLILATLTVAAITSGCGQQASAPATPAQAASAKATDAHDHSGWWCTEHGVPEGICGLCDSKLAAEMQKKGDWCKEHDRPESQCFLCHPDLEAKFAAQYEAKFGKKPPKREG